MEDRISDLLGIIRDEIRIYRDLIEHARNKTNLFVQGRADAIQESNRIEETFFLRLQAIGLKRLRLCNDLSFAFGIPREEFTLARLSEHLDHPFALELGSQIKLFRNVVLEMSRISACNRKLIEQALNYSNGMMAVIANASGAYQSSGVFGKIPAVQPTFSQSI